MRTTNHPLEPEELMAYFDGELSPDRATRAAEHLGSCPECQEIASDLRGLSDRMLAWQIETPSSAAPMLTQVGKLQTIARPAYHRWLLWGLSAACLLAAIGFVSRSPQHRVEMQMAQFSQSESARPAPPPVPVGKSLPQPGSSAPLIAYTARLALVANNFDRARDALQDILNRHHGYIAQMTVNAEESSSRSIDASVRTPTAQLDATISEIKALGHLVSESRGGEEVTQQSVDLDARLANARNTEERLTDLLKHRTDKLADILAVENQISETRGEIEQMEAERKNLSHRVEYAQLDVRITEEYKAQLDGSRTSTSTQLRNAAVEGYAVVVATLLAVVMFLLSYGPVMLIWCAILFFPARFAWRRFGRR